MADYGIVRSFGIDDGELDGVEKHEAFVLGYECAQIDAKLKELDGFRATIHAENVPRLEAECKRLNRAYKFSWHNDQSEAWCELSVADRLLDNHGEG